MPNLSILLIALPVFVLIVAIGCLIGALLGHVSARYGPPGFDSQGRERVGIPDWDWPAK